MNFIKNNLKYFVLAILIIAIFILCKRPIANLFSVTVQQKEIMQEPVSQLSVREYFTKELEDEFNTIWQNFEKIGLSKQRYEQAKQENRNRYLRSDFPGGISQVSQETVNFVRGIIQECGLDPSAIIIKGFKDVSPAAATERVMYINESEFNNYSQPAKRFVIGHELQHILNKDDHSRFTLEVITKNKVENLGANRDHPLCQYNRFKEKRADIMTAIQNEELAQGYLAFAQEWYKRVGDNPGISHPYNKDRLKLAQTIVNYMNNQKSI